MKTWLPKAALISCATIRNSSARRRNATSRGFAAVSEPEQTIMKAEINLRIVLQKPPVAVAYGLQMGQAAKSSVVQHKMSTGDDLIFEFPVATKPGKNGSPDFSGLFVHGPLGGRFVYISVGVRAGQLHTTCDGRMKIPLTGIAASAIDELITTTGVLETTVPGTGKNGGPAYATVKPFDGWSVVADAPAQGSE